VFLRRTSTQWVVAIAAALAALAAAIVADAASPPEATLTPNAQAVGQTSWTGSVNPGTETGASDQGEFCFDEAGRPDPATSGCDFFRLNVTVPSDFYRVNPGGVQVDVTDFGETDIDMYIYRRNANGTRGDFVIGDGDVPGEDENALIEKASGRYYVVLTPFATPPAQSYKGIAKFATRRGPSIDELNRRAPRGLPNYRASRDQYTSHSEPSIAMDPLDHDHLIAASKMYENNADYLFKVGTYESYDGGRTWRDLGHLPGYCEAPGQCDPSNEETYRTTSDPVVDFDDEGNAYANVLDAPGGTFAFTGFNMTFHIKKPRRPWSRYITAHDNRNNPVTEQALLDDKNWIAVDNVTDVNGGPNRPRDGKIGTIYMCWSFDGSQAPLQQIVVMRSLDGGQTWGGFAPGDNTPYQVSQKTAISGIGCHFSIGPRGEVYVTWYDNTIQALMQAKSTDRGRTFTPAFPIAMITGVDDPFEGEGFRNLSIPTSGIDPKGNLYVAVASRNADGAPVASGALQLGRKIKSGETNLKDWARSFRSKPANDLAGQEYKAGGDGAGPESGADIVMFKSTDGGNSWTGPVRVNQDKRNSDADQFQPWMDVTDKGQVNIMFFDRRNDPTNYFIDTYLARSNDGGRTFKDTRASASMWDASVNAPTSVSGKFIGDYQGLVADDDVAIPFWNDTQHNNLPKSDPNYSPYQEVFAARVPNVPSRGGPGLGSTIGGRFVISRRAVKISRRGIAKIRVSCRSPLGCKGRIKLRTARRVKRVRRGGERRRVRATLGKRSFSIRPRKRRTVIRIRISRNGRRSMRRLRKTPVDALASVRIGTEIRGTAKRRFRLHRARVR
jgi:hypothetical protein